MKQEPAQFEFLNRLRKERRVVSVYLLSGLRLVGRIASFDREALLLQTKDGDVFAFQQQISTLGPEVKPLRAAPRVAPADDERPPPRRNTGPAPAATVIHKPRRRIAGDP